MERVTVFLRTALFSYGNAQAHVPAGVMVLEGAVVDRPHGGLTVQTSRLLDQQGRDQGEVELVLHLPWAKVDHLLVHEG